VDLFRPDEMRAEGARRRHFLLTGAADGAEANLRHARHGLHLARPLKRARVAAAHAADLFAPVEVGVDVQDVHRLADGIEGVHDRDRDAVVAAQHDELRLLFPDVPHARGDGRRVGAEIAAVERDVAHVDVRGQA